MFTLDDIESLLTAAASVLGSAWAWERVCAAYQKSAA